MKIKRLKNLMQLFYLFGFIILTTIGYSQNNSDEPITTFVSPPGVLKVEKSDELKGKMKSIEVEDGENASFYFVPSIDKSDNYLFVFHEWWGLNENIKKESDKWSERLIEVNVVAIDLYDGKIAENDNDATKYMQNAKPERIHAIIEAVKKWTGDSVQIATIGWAYGGGWSMKCAIQIKESAVGCVLFYGIPERDTAILADLHCSVLGVFGKKDIWVNNQVVAQYESAMKKKDKKFLTYWFDAGHGFTNPANRYFDYKLTKEANEKVHDYLNSVFIGEAW